MCIVRLFSSVVIIWPNQNGTFPFIHKCRLLKMWCGVKNVSLFISYSYTLIISWTMTTRRLCWHNWHSFSLNKNIGRRLHFVRIHRTIFLSKVKTLCLFPLRQTPHTQDNKKSIWFDLLNIRLKWSSSQKKNVLLCLLGQWWEDVGCVGAELSRAMTRNSRLLYQANVSFIQNDVDFNCTSYLLHFSCINFDRCLESL